MRVFSDSCRGYGFTGGWRRRTVSSESPTVRSTGRRAHDHGQLREILFAVRSGVRLSVWERFKSVLLCPWSYLIRLALPEPSALAWSRTHLAGAPRRPTRRSTFHPEPSRRIEARQATAAATISHRRGHGNCRYASGLRTRLMHSASGPAPAPTTIGQDNCYRSESTQPPQLHAALHTSSATYATPATPAPVLELHNLQKRFGRLEVLRSIDLNAYAGDAISIIGASGSGKSTLLRCINLLERPNTATINLDGEELRLRRQRDGLLYAIDRKQLDRFRSQLGFVFQNFNLWPHMTILQNVIEGPVYVKRVSKSEAREQAEALLDKVGLTEKRDAYPLSLSGGQQQRAAIARALAMRPKVILLDEPTSALDPELVGEVQGVIRTLADEGHTMLIVTHEMSFARDVSTRVVFLDNGIIEEEGTSADLFENPKSERFRRFLASTKRS